MLFPTKELASLVILHEIYFTEYTNGKLHNKATRNNIV